VKGGSVKPNDVKALYSDIENEPNVTAGVFVCFGKYRQTVKNAASSKTFKDKIAGNEWPVIQILTVEDMLAGEMPKLPNPVMQQGFKTKRAQPTLFQPGIGKESGTSPVKTTRHKSDRLAFD
jgi:hypothetical protein